MAESAIAADLLNPGQVFACLGFLEAAELLCGDATGGFDWANGADGWFWLQAAGNESPFAVVLKFLARAKALVPAQPKTHPSAADEKLAKPILLVSDGIEVALGHWADGSSREPFKLYAGNRSAERIAGAMLEGTSTLWNESREAVVTDPFNVLAPMGGSFNFDPRAGWTAINLGYSPNEHKHRVWASPIVEILAAWGLEHARPARIQGLRMQYGAWAGAVPPSLARPALGGADVGVPLRRFQFVLEESGRNKVVTFAKEKFAQ